MAAPVAVATKLQVLYCFDTLVEALEGEKLQPIAHAWNGDK